jgi:hypothetical protein
MNEDLRNWFSKNHPEGNWKRYNTKGEAIGPCAREPGEPKPKCLSNEKAGKMSKTEIASAVKRKRKIDPVADRKGKGGNPIMSSNKIDEGIVSDIVDKIKGRKQIGTTGSGGKVYIRTNPKKTKVEYKSSKKPTINSQPKKNNSSLDDPWIRTASGREKVAQYRQIRGEEFIISQFKEIFENISKDSCGFGEYWCNTDRVCKPIPSGMKIDGQKTRPTEVGIGVLVGGSCNHSKKETFCPVHGMSCCPNKSDKNTKENVNFSLSEKIILEIEAEDINEENKPTNPSLWSKAKTLAKKKFDVYPSAYANGWAAKWYKSKGGGWKSIKEETIEDLNGNAFIEINDLISVGSVKEENPCWKGYTQVGTKTKGGKQVPNCVPVKNKSVDESVRIKSKTGNLMLVVAMWRGKSYSLKIFFSQSKLPSRSEVQDQIQKIYPGAKVTYLKVTNYEPGQPFFYTEEESSNFSQEISEDWQSVNRKDKTDGLSQAAVDAYRRENPGSKLQTAVTEKKPTGKRADRRSNFCRRMKGMKSKLTSTKTAKDPDSRINKALRRWNCN